MNFIFFIDRLRDFFRQFDESDNTIYLEENSMNKKYHIRKRMFLNDNLDMPAYIVAIVEDTRELQNSNKDEFHYGEVSLTLSDCYRQISYDFCLYDEESRNNSLNKIKRLAETFKEFHDALEKEIEMIENLKGKKQNRQTLNTNWSASIFACTPKPRG